MREQVIFKTYAKLPSALQRVLTRSDILFVLENEDLYVRLSDEKEVNITAFLSLKDFISLKARQEGRFIACSTIEAILRAENEYYLEMMPILYF